MHAPTSGTPSGQGRPHGADAPPGGHAPYPPIAEHGMVGDLQTCALISSAGTVDWFCAPRFDSPSVFAALLDHERGGHFTVAARATGESSVKQLYLADTAILLTRFLTEDGIGEVIDLMPVSRPQEPTDRHVLMRLVRTVRGRVRYTAECRPRFDYGRTGHTLSGGPGTMTFRSEVADAHLQTVGPVRLKADGADAVGGFVLAQGETAGFVLTTCAPGGEEPAPVSAEAAEETMRATAAHWRAWVAACTYRGRWQEAVHRSAITLKLLTYAPTGAPVAAATAGLPEEIGGERNWDYRYTWIRDAALSVRALTDIGFTEEAHAFRRWLLERLAEGAGPEGEPLQIMYRVDGDPSLEEVELKHWEGYRGSRPVRVGNAAADHLQLDIYGEAAFALAETADGLDGSGHAEWKAFAGVLDWLAGAWDRPDEGIWETRGGRQDYTFSRVMCWVAFDRGVRMATAHARPADVPRWTAARDAILEQVMERGRCPSRRSFVQRYGDDTVDASLLLMPLVGFVAARDRDWLGTLDAITEELVTDSLVLRYDPHSSPDGLAGLEGTFSLCTFLYVDALARAGRLEDARYAFDKMQTYANHVGLFAEEIGTMGEQLGNFPQAFTHLALIIAAVTLDRELGAAGR
ncbi:MULTISPECIES: glycoside hydrolase family 15 protein [unclassified Streptomyces]|uniref:glycoside hydrolase family 15 protein n=1 Tax=unclassified Streptomyces TaxID=2593676 RepID=UPI003805E276